MDLFKKLLNSGYVLLYQLTNLLIPIILVPVYFKQFGAEVYGEYAVYSSAVGILAVIAAMGTSAEGLRMVSDCSTRSYLVSVVTNIIIVQFIAVLLMTLLWLIIVFGWDNLRLNASGPLPYAVSANIITEGFNLFWVFQGRSDFKRYVAVYSTIRLVFMVILTLIISRFDGFYFVPIYWMLCSLLTTIILISLLVRDSVLNLRELSFKYSISYIKKSIGYTLSNLVVISRDKIAVIITGNLVNFESAAFYEVSQKIVNILKLLFVVLRDANFSSFTGESGDSSLYRMMRFSLLAGVVVSSGVMFFSFLDLGDYFAEYDELLVILRFYIWVVPLSVVSMYYGTALVIYEKRAQFLTSTILSSAFFILALVFVPKISILALILIVLLSLGLESLVRIILIRSN